MHTQDRISASAVDSRWTDRLVVFLRVMAILSLFKGLYHWSLICGFLTESGAEFEAHPMPWRASTVFFAVIDLVAAVGLWLTAAWGGVVWLTAAISLAAVELLFPQVYGGRLWVVYAEAAAILIYLGLALAAARERPN
jgi:hypothetical protein